MKKRLLISSVIGFVIALAAYMAMVIFEKPSSTEEQLMKNYSEKWKRGVDLKAASDLYNDSGNRGRNSNDKAQDYSQSVNVGIEALHNSMEADRLKSAADKLRIPREKRMYFFGWIAKNSAILSILILVVGLIWPPAKPAAPIASPNNASPNL